MARRATIIKEKLQEETPHLIVDAGNFVRGTGVANELKAKYLAKAMRLMGYDAISLGREEVLLGADRILDLRDRERIPLVSTNLLRPGGHRWLVSSYLLKRLDTSRFLGFEYGGLTVAIVGLASEGLRNPQGRQVSRGLIVADPQEPLEGILGKLKKHCDLIVVLSDLTLRKAKELVQRVGGIDVFFIQQEVKEKYVEQTDGTIFIRPAARGTELGDIELILDDHNRITSHQVQWTLLDKNVVDDEQLSQLVADYKAALEKRRLSRRGCGKR